MEAVTSAEAVTEAEVDVKRLPLASGEVGVRVI
jgi:hypothetical protein